MNELLQWGLGILGGIAALVFGGMALRGLAGGIGALLRLMFFGSLALAGLGTAIFYLGSRRLGG